MVRGIPQAEARLTGVHRLGIADTAALDMGLAEGAAGDTLLAAAGEATAGEAEGGEAESGAPTSEAVEGSAAAAAGSGGSDDASGGKGKRRGRGRKQNRSRSGATCRAPPTRGSVSTRSASAAVRPEGGR